jgi:hypothetical protein
VDEAPLTLGTHGVFVARADAEGGYRLFRILYVLRAQPAETALFVSVYDVKTDTVEQAREAAQQPYLPLLVRVDILTERQFRAVPHEIVWFRSLNEEERSRVQ